MPTTTMQYLLDVLIPQCYYLPSLGPPSTELGATCSVFPYLTAVAQHSPMY